MGAFVGILIVLVIFLVIREFWTWYWKQNEVVKQLQATRKGRCANEENWIGYTSVFRL